MAAAGGGGTGGGGPSGGGGMRVANCCGVSSGGPVGAGEWDAWFGPSTPAVTLWQLGERLLPGVATRTAAHVVLFGVVGWDDARVESARTARTFPVTVTRDEYAHFLALFGPQAVAATTVRHLFQSPVGAVRPSLVPWYGSHMSRGAAEAAVLQGGRPGAYVVRACSHWHDLAITYAKVADGGALVPEHMLVRRGVAADGTAVYLRADEAFPSLLALLATYRGVYAAGAPTRLSGISGDMARCEVLDTPSCPPLPLSLPAPATLPTAPPDRRGTPAATLVPPVLPAPAPMSAPAPAPAPFGSEHSARSVAHELLPPTIAPASPAGGQPVLRLASDPGVGMAGASLATPLAPARSVSLTTLPSMMTGGANSPAAAAVRNPVGEAASRVLCDLARYLSYPARDAAPPARAAIATIDDTLRAANVDLCSVLTGPTPDFMAVSEHARLDARSTLGEIGKMLGPLPSGALPAAEHYAAGALQAIATRGYAQLARCMLSVATCLSLEYSARRGGGGGGGGKAAAELAAVAAAVDDITFKGRCAAYVLATLRRPPRDLYGLPQQLLEHAFVLAQAVLSAATNITDPPERTFINSTAYNSLYVLNVALERPLADRLRLANTHLHFVESARAFGLQPASAATLDTLRARVAQCSASPAAAHSGLTPSAGRAASPAAVSPAAAAAMRTSPAASPASAAVGIVPSPAAS